MKISLRFLFTAGLGAAAMYYFDPERGRERRALLRERLERLEQRRASETDEARAREGGVESGRTRRQAASREGTPDQPDPVH